MELPSTFYTIYFSEKFDSMDILIHFRKVITVKKCFHKYTNTSHDIWAP